LNYIESACPRISIENNTQANHFELVDFLIRFNYEFKGILEEFISPQKELEVLKMLKNEFFDLFIKERYSLVEIILKERFKKLRQLLDDTKN
jgi:hypothetical protein